MIHIPTMQKLRVFSDKYPLLGPLIYIFSVQYFVVQVIVARAWTTSFSYTDNVISDLGNTACGPHGPDIVCSPLHGLMNASFIMLGLTMAIGSLLIYHEFKRSHLSLVGFSCMALAGIGTILVGLFPENTIGQLHGTGAFLTFGFGNLSLVLLAIAIRQARASFRVYSFISGIVSLTSLVFFALHINLGLGRGGIERAISYPQTLWLILFGLYMSATRIRAHRPKG